MSWPRRAFLKHDWRAAWAAAILLFPAAWTGYGQTPQTPPSISGGQGEIAFQGYYLGANQQDLVYVTGTSFRFEEFLPNLGYLTGGVEGFAAQTRFQTGNNFLELRGTPWLNHYWTLTGGDFRVSSNLVPFPFNNIYNPEINARGVKLQAAHGDTQYTFFYGQETLTAGPRVAYLFVSPQTMAGVSAVRKLARHWLVGARLMQFSTSMQGIVENPFLFPAGRDVPQVRTMALQSIYTPDRRVKFYAEVSRPMAEGERSVTSWLAGASWESGILTARANYASQDILYFPLAGFYSGDRQGPFAEARLHVRKGLEFYGSASQYRNNLEHDEDLPFLKSSSAAVGISALLPGRFSLTGQLSTVHYSEQIPGDGTTISNNRQIEGALSRGIGRHTVQVNWRDIRMDTQPAPQRQRSSEAGDTYQFRHFSLGGSVRYQQMTGNQSMNSLFFRGLGQVSLGRFSAYANVEIGNDLANQTIFSTEAYRTSMAGVSLRMGRGWNLQTEVFRNQLNFEINPENIFLLENSAALAGASPMAESLSAISQWSFYFGMSKQLHWGAGLPAETIDDSGVRAAPLVGNIEGIVHLNNTGTSAYVPGIPVSVDGGPTVFTGPDGHFLIQNVAEGPHEVALALEKLPADFDPTEPAKLRVVVHPRRSARADFAVLPLLAIRGQVHGPDKAPLEDIVIRLSPGGRYTTTNKEGRFVFYNLHEGDYEVALDAKSLPEGGELKSAASVPLAVRVGSEPPTVEFTFTVNVNQKPVRKVLDRK